MILTKENIENLGYIEDSKSPVNLYQENGDSNTYTASVNIKDRRPDLQKCTIVYNYITNFCSIFAGTFNSYGDVGLRFRGYINTIEELKVLLNQIRITIKTN